MKTKSIYWLGGLIMFVLLIINSCVNIPEFENIDIIQSDAEYAIPLVNSKLTLESVLSYNIENSNISYDESGLALIEYQSDIVQKKANEIFKTILFPAPLPFSDTVEYMRFDQEADYLVEKGTFRGDSIRFGFTSSFDEVINIEVGIREAEMDGERFKHQISINPGESIVTPLYSIRGYDFTSPDNLISFYYDARNASGERLVMDNPFFEFTYLVFDFIQGYLGKNTQQLNAHDIDVNIFELWESGLLEFENPKIKIRLDNSFGFPVKAIINKFEITNLEGEVIPLESTLFDEDIIFDYPDLNEIGQIKSSTFTFDKDNSNFATAFNQKVIRVSYDVDALANPDDDESLIGFYLFDSYYLLNVAVELPMRFKAEKFQLFDKFPISFDIPEELDQIESFELKTYISNLFPVDVYTQLYFMDDTGFILDSLFTDGEQHFPAATIENDGTITPAASGLEPFFITYDDQRKEVFNKATHLAPKVRFSTQNNDQEWTTITKDQGLDVKIGLKFKLK